MTFGVCLVKKKKPTHVNNANRILIQSPLAVWKLTAERRVDAFEHKCLRVVGVAFAEIDELEAQTDEALHRRTAAAEIR